jgi:aspartokinase-like uncharacterized kinase
MSPTSRARRLSVLRQRAVSASRSLIVYKIGGSLFDLPELPNVIRHVLAQRPESSPLLVAGGGRAADLVREWDSVHELGADSAHALALEAMDLGASLLAHFLPEARLVRSEQQVRMAAGDHAVSILCSGCFIKAAEAEGHPALEHSWRVTSDSIAAWAAHILGATELVLVKSRDVSCEMTPSAAAQAGLVDEHFPTIAEGVPTISWVNGRNDVPLIESWRCL